VTAPRHVTPPSKRSAPSWPASSQKLARIWTTARRRRASCARAARPRRQKWDRSASGYARPKSRLQRRAHARAHTAHIPPSSTTPDSAFRCLAGAAAAVPVARA
jgi:hypothetical protein